MTEAERIVGKCSCRRDWTVRSKIDPDCHWHEYAEDITSAITQAVAEERERCAKVAEDPKNLNHIGGSTGNAYGTALKIATAIRATP